MSGQITLQALKSADWQRNRDIRLRALASAPDSFGSLHADEATLGSEQWRERLMRPHKITYVAVTPAGADVGLIVGAPYDEHAGLFSMWVDPSHRHQGIAGRLVDAVITWALQSGYAQIFLDVGVENIAAQMLYESRGFRPTGVGSNLAPPREHLAEMQFRRTLEVERPTENNRED